MLKPKKASKNDVVYIPEVPTKLLKPRNPRQAAAISSLCNNSITILTGPAGTGKTYLAASKALDLLQAGIISQIVITRPYVASEKMGFLPGEIADKFEPYLAPYMDAFTDRVGKQVLNQMLSDGRIQAQPIAFIQGKTFNHAMILLDEVENATSEQIKLVLTRLGDNSRACLMGDTDQSYINNSGFFEAIRILESVPRLQIVEFEICDVVRSETCRHVLEAYARAKQ
jgi:phosphate starvation-inducible PhoH-like protein